MISVTRLNGTSLVINAEMIEQVEATPDTIVSLTGGKKITVLESVDDVVSKVILYRRMCSPFSQMAGNQALFNKAVSD